MATHICPSDSFALKTLQSFCSRLYLGKHASKRLRIDQLERLLLAAYDSSIVEGIYLYLLVFRNQIGQPSQSETQSSSRLPNHDRVQAPTLPNPNLCPDGPFSQHVEFSKARQPRHTEKQTDNPVTQIRIRMSNLSGL